MKAYDHKKIESKVQKEWEKKKIYQAKDGKGKKFYSLIEFPYPSGDGLHVGHIRSNTAMDIISRKRRMEGYNVLYPIGWDAFGLPTENYAIKTGKKPSVVTKKNTDTFRRQLKEIGFSFDWSREVNTTDPKYYKWTQWIFLQFFKKGLAYKAKSYINWCPKDKIGLANEEAVGGICDRCGSATEKREKEQWMLAITKYADRLDKDLDLVDYPERVKIQQRNWIGKSEGSEIEFKLKIAEQQLFHGSHSNLNVVNESNIAYAEKSSAPQFLKVFTTRADTLFGVTYVVLAPEHKLINDLKSRITNWGEVEKYIENAKRKSEIERTDDKKEKTGIELKGVKAINPANNEEVSVWIADYVLADYGTGAVMAVPAHDERDFIFAKKYNLSIKQVIEPVLVQTAGTAAFRENEPVNENHGIIAVIKHWSEDKYLGLYWPEPDWGTFLTGGIDEGFTPEETVLKEIYEETGYKNVKIIKELGFVHSKYYHAPKKQNRFGHTPAFLVQILNEEKDKIAEDEKKRHEIKWLTKKELESFLTGKSHLQVLKFLDSPLYIEYGLLTNSGEFNGVDSEEVQKKITEFVGGKMVTKFKLRDWVFSRQRYWGEPIPIINCGKCGLVPVPEKDLPIKLPEVKSYKPMDNGESPLASISKWVNTKCPKCGGKAKRETDTMPNWAGSSWYYLRYIDPKNNKAFADKKKLKYWTPVDWYNGGMEHTTLHLLYSRFWHKFLYDLKLVPTPEPYKKRTSHGMILGEGGVKMSKSLGNVVNPDDIVKTYGADTLRIYEMFMGPFEESVAWSTESIIGSRRFIEKVWRIGEKIKEGKANNFLSLRPRSQKDREPTTLENHLPSLLPKLLHKTIKKVSEDIESMRFNTAISAMMILATEMEKTENISTEDFKKFLQILAPFAPHITEDIWFSLKEKGSIHLSNWPKWDENAIIDQEIKIAVQINGKVRAEILIQTSDEEDAVKKKALADQNILRHLNNKDIKRVIYVKNKVINILN